MIFMGCKLVVEAKWCCPICLALARKWNKQHVARRCFHKHLWNFHHLRDVPYDLIKRKVVLV
jgi:hypothetical protein